MRKDGFSAFVTSAFVASPVAALSTLTKVLGLALVAVLSVGTAFSAQTAAADERPNILLIVADDLGYSDVGSFGGEVQTPNLDALAARGLRTTSFYTSATCSPTRSILLSGVDNHVAGLGNMAEFLGPEQKGKPGYEGYLNERVVSVANVLRDAGYHTYMAGKWHLGEDPAQWPGAKGFERYFTLLQGGGSNWADMLYPNPAHPHLTFTLNGKLLDKLPEDHFSSAAFSDFIIASTIEDKADDKPFFAYLSFQAVHSPLAAPDDWLEKYRGRYDEGYDVVRAKRLARMKELGLVTEDTAAFPRLPNIPAWDQLTKEEQKLSARKMEVYAAMLANMDYHIGRVLAHLETMGKLDNTLVIFLSDNGAESIEFLDLVKKVFSPEAKKWIEATFDMRPESWGRKGSVVDYGPAWAQVSSVPFSFFKPYVAEGGIRSPLIVAGPGVNHHGDISDAVLHVSDIVPTLIETAGTQHPSMLGRSNLAPLQGISMLPLFSGKAERIRSESDWLGWELFGNRAVRQGDWKLRYLLKEAGGTGAWQLFNLRNDPAELQDVSKKNPGKREELLKLWARYVQDNGVILTGDGPFKQRANSAVVEE